MATVHRSFRLAAPIADALDAAAATRGLDRTTLARRLIAEGLVREEHPLVAFRNSPDGRIAFLPVADIEVWNVIAVLRAGKDPLAELGLLDVELSAALHYFDAYRVEIDRTLRRDQLAQARDAERERRDLEILNSLQPG